MNQFIKTILLITILFLFWIEYTVGNVIYRINLAWINDLETLKNILEKHQTHKIFIDMPKNRTKPPNNKYSMNEIKPILETYPNITHFAISNDPLPEIDAHWSGLKRTKAEFESMKRLEANMDESEIKLRFRAFG